MHQKSNLQAPTISLSPRGEGIKNEDHIRYLPPSIPMCIGTHCLLLILSVIFQETTARQTHRARGILQPYSVLRKGNATPSSKPHLYSFAMDYHPVTIESMSCHSALDAESISATCGFPLPALGRGQASPPRQGPLGPGGFAGMTSHKNKCCGVLLPPMITSYRQRRRITGLGKANLVKLREEPKFPGLVAAKQEVASCVS